MLRAAQHGEVADDRLQAWLVAVAWRLCLDDHRRRANETARWKRLSGQAAIEQTVEEEVCERSEAAWVSAVLAELLPPRQVRALQLVAAGCDVEQVATRLGVRYRAAESLLARARRTIRAAIGATFGVAVWTWRSQLPAVTGNAVTLGLASVASVAFVMIIPPVVSTPEPARPPPPAASAVIADAPTALERPIRIGPAASWVPTPSAPEYRTDTGDVPPSLPPSLRPPPADPPPLVPLRRLRTSAPRLAAALPRAIPLSAPALPALAPPVGRIERAPVPLDDMPPIPSVRTILRPDLARFPARIPELPIQP
jgi:RNA polymerase sigma factor (sigma-70 family)